MKVEQVPCFILHRRPYRETSLIIDVVAQDYGRLNLVLKGGQPSKKSATSALAQVFRPLLLSFGGNGELKSAYSIEDNGPALKLQDKYLYSGFYLNELICRLWPQNIDSDTLYQHYQQSLAQLYDCQQTTADNPSILELVLRRFEFNLLTLLGFGIDCFSASHSGDAIVATQNYRFEAQQGFIPVVQSPDQPFGQAIFGGADILAIGDMNFSDVNVLKTAKQLIRLALAPHLGQKPLKSRELFLQMQN